MTAIVAVTLSTNEVGLIRDLRIDVVYVKSLLRKGDDVCGVCIFVTRSTQIK